MSWPYNPTWPGDITLEVKDANGNVIGNVVIDQATADKLYQYYIVKVKNDLLADPQWVAYLKIAMYAPFAWLVPPSTTSNNEQTSTANTCPAYGLGFGMLPLLMFQTVAMVLPFMLFKGLFSNPFEQLMSLIVLIPLINAIK